MAFGRMSRESSTTIDEGHLKSAHEADEMQDDEGAQTRIDE